MSNERQGTITRVRQRKIGRHATDDSSLGALRREIRRRRRSLRRQVRESAQEVRRGNGHIRANWITATLVVHNDLLNWIEAQLPRGLSGLRREIAARRRTLQEARRERAFYGIARAEARREVERDLTTLLNWIENELVS